MAKGKKAEAEAPVETPAEPKMTQKDAVKQALAAGADQPTDGVEFIKTKFDIDLSNASFSTLKSLLKKEEGGGEAPQAEKRKPGRPPANPPQENGVEKLASAHVNGNGSPAALAMAVKQLVAQHGAVAIHDMVRVFES